MHTVVGDLYSQFIHFRRMVGVKSTLIEPPGSQGPIAIGIGIGIDRSRIEHNLGTI
jgi:hypothetical protein